jgi:hypothetical protein
MSWQPLTHPPRRLLIGCWECHAFEVNESNRLRRLGWQESSRAPRLYRCGDCASLDQPPALLVMPDLGAGDAA